MRIFNWLENEKIYIKNKDLVVEALTHHSYINEHKEENAADYQRLEFLGDAVLQIWVATKLYTHIPAFSEGEMTRLRSKLVDTNACSNYAREMDLIDDIRLGTGEEKNGGRNREHLLEDVFEALIGAIYIDQGSKAVDIILEKLITPLINDQDQIVEKNYKSILQEYIQSDNRDTPDYILVNKTGPDNSPVFYVNVLVDKIILGQGKGNSKKQAEQNAAKEALNKLKVE